MSYIHTCDIFVVFPHIQVFATMSAAPVRRPLLASVFQYAVEPGKYEFLIGAASVDIRLKLPVAVVAQ